MELIEIQRGLRAAAEAADSAYAACASAKAAFTNLDALEKSKLAILCMKYSDGVMAENKVTRMALASDEYQKFLTQVAFARLDYLKAQSVVDALELKAKMLQSLNKNYLGEFESTKSFQ